MMILLQQAIRNALHIIFTSIQLKMNEFVQMEELIQGINDPKKSPKPKKHYQLRDHYNQLESSLSSKIEEKSQQQKVEKQPDTTKIRKQAPRFKLVLPAMAEADAPQERNNNVKNKRVLVQPVPASTLKQSKTAGQLKIYDLQDEIEEQLVQNPAQNIQYSNPVNPDLFFNSKKGQLIKQVNFQQNESVQQQKSQFFVIKQQKKPQQLFKKVVLDSSPENNGFSQQHQKNRLLSKIIQNDAPITKGIFVSKKNSQEDMEYIFQDSGKKSLDSGFQTTSVYTSRDELSTRNILPANLVQKPSKRYKLPELKPYKQILENKLYQMPSQTLLKEEQPEKPAESPKKVKMTRQRQVVISGNQITNIPLFVKSTVPYGKRLECNLVRNKKCCFGCYLDYDLITTDGKYLVSCKKMPFNINSTYNISLQQGIFGDKSGYFIGKVQGNFTGSVFNMYTYIPDSLQDLEVTATIVYSTDFICCGEKTRQFQIYLKHKDCRYYELLGTEIEKGRNLKELYEIVGNQGFKRISKYVNKQPQWNPRYEMFSLNFHKRAKFASVKNAIIVKEGKPQNELMLIAKKGQNQFAFEISYPFSPMVALGVLITGFDFKMATQ